MVLDIKRGIYMSKGLDFLMLETTNIYTQVSNIIKFFFDTYEIDYAETITKRYIDFLLDSCGCYKNEKAEVIKILYDEIDKEKMRKIIWG